MGDEQRLRPACTYAQSDQSLCSSLEHSMNIKLLTEHHFEFLSLIGGCTGLSESIHVKIPLCWKSHVAAQLSSCWRVAVSIICFFLTVPWVGLQCVIVIFPGHIHLPFGHFNYITIKIDQFICVSC